MVYAIDTLSFIKTARKPRAFKLGDEWLSGAMSALAGQAEDIRERAFFLL
jgi:hypothetical protein